MIGRLEAGKYMSVTNSDSNVFFNSTLMSAGMLRYNPNSSTMEVYDGYNWRQLGGPATVSLTHDAEKTIQWATEKMQQEQKIDALCEKYPGLKNARDNYETFLAMVSSQE